jgi:F-type H+-transporting ATPase subunit c
MTSRSVKITIQLLTTFVILGISTLAFAGDGDAAGAAASNVHNGGYVALAAGLGLGIAALGGALGQGRAAATALDGIARNPGAADKLFVPMILGLAFIESLVIYSLIFVFLVMGKI